LVTASHE
jgi:hypothetical protein